MIFISVLLNLLLFSRKYKSSNPHYASHQEFSSDSPSSLSPTLEEKDFNSEKNSYSNMAIILRKYYHLTPNISLDESPPYLSNENTTDIRTIQKFYRYYQILQTLQSPYVSQKEKINTIQRETDIFPTSSAITRPSIWNGLDW